MVVSHGGTARSDIFQRTLPRKRGRTQSQECTHAPGNHSATSWVHTRTCPRRTLCCSVSHDVIRSPLMDEDNSPSLPPRKILGIAGSLRQASYNRAALRAARSWRPRAAPSWSSISRAFRPSIRMKRQSSGPRSGIERRRARGRCHPARHARNTTIRFRACSRTPSTGRHARTAGREAGGGHGRLS